MNETLFRYPELEGDDPGGRRHKTIGAHLTEAGVITAEALSEGLALAQQAGIRIGRALVMLRHIGEPQLASVLSQQHAVPFHDHKVHPPDHAVARMISERQARAWRAIPVTLDGESVTVAMVDPSDTEALGHLEAALGKPAVPVIVTEGALEEMLEAVYQEEYTERSVRGLMMAAPHQSAYQVLSRRQKITFGLVVLVSLVWLALSPLSYGVALMTIATLFHVAFTVHRFYLIQRSMSHDLTIPVTREEVAALVDRDLPLYTILVPLYREAAVLPKLARGITSLDYPLAKLDVKLLLEADDQETIQAARALDLPPNFELVIVPTSMPKTKPKACNYGLIKARGEFVVIYDAEDIPDRDQLKKAVVAFAKSGDDMVCLQAKLNYYNRNQNVLTRWFTIEYSMWFDMFLPGLVASRAPIPLGGTSNHFRRDKLEELHAWDPFNVTEDADLGIRLYKAGYTTGMIDSTTFEEANSDVKNWIRQRSRWVKGYIQTWLVHMRSPLASCREMGLKAFLNFNLTVSGTFICFLINPFFWLLTILWFLTRWDVIQPLFPPSIYYLGLVNLVIGNFAIVYTSLAGLLRRGYTDLARYALITPFYWVLISIAAWKGFIQLFSNPFYWEKTVHGLYHETPAADHAEQQAAAG
ncbi:MAG: hypothetical protein RLZZ387_879 [Chloroflexota bacterium]|jgi:cellulose synthase/poly-beta-1,6-N-acetylglucosamine synthase-like glycosyltransferase